MKNRIKISCACLLAVFICFTSIGYTQTSGESKDVDTAKIRSKVKEYADANKKVKVITTLSENAKGRIVKYGDSDFTLKVSKTGNEQVFAYGKVRGIHKIGGLSTATIISLAAVGTVGAIVGGFLLKRCRNELGC